jgi:hypothetical protein
MPAQSVKHAVESGTTVLLPRDSLVHVLDQSDAAPLGVLAQLY